MVEPSRRLAQATLLAFLVAATVLISLLVAASSSSSATRKTADQRTSNDRRYTYKDDDRFPRRRSGCGFGDAGFAETTGEEEDFNATLQLASDLLESIGVADLCHPFRGDVPGFPLCGDVISGGGGERQKRDARLSWATTKSAYQQPQGRQRRLDEYYGYEQDPEQEPEDDEEPKWNMDVPNLVAAIFCVVCSGLASGLTVGLLSLDPLVLLIKSRAGSEEIASQANALLPIVKQHHLLLVTLLVVNTASSESLPMFLNE